ncbi:MAG: MATE family efflux transporter [Fusicatenibacter sp.]|nr:MATE family efflux transporter [Fusicatenibacter sp.]
MKRQFYKYVSQNVAGMIGVSVYILADTFFISVCAGANGITVLNLALPIYGLIFAIGSMIGVGSATRYAIRKAQGQKDTDYYFTQAILWDLILGIPFMLLGIFAPEKVLWFMGADELIMELGKEYVKIFMAATPLFMMNYVFTSFARNDQATTIAMIGSISGSLFNIVFDYLFMFPMGLGLTGAALATMCSPIVTSLVCCIHYFGKKNQVRFRWKRPSVRQLFFCCQLGVSAFVGEISSAVTTVVFNLLILGIAGNVGVAAYGVVANLSLIAMAIFNGISQGVQPLISTSYGHGKQKEVSLFLRLGLKVSLITEGILVAIAWVWTDFLIGIFNSEGNKTLLYYAQDGMRLYFLGYLFAGVNILLVGYFAATARAKQAFIASILRGALAIVLCAVVMAKIWGMNGVWLSFLASEIITFAAILMMKYVKKPIRNVRN